MNNQKKVFQSLTLILQFGLNMIVPIVLCTMLGAWIGKKYDIPVITVPLFIIDDPLDSRLDNGFRTFVAREQRHINRGTLQASATVI